MTMPAIPERNGYLRRLPSLGWPLDALLGGKPCQRAVREPKSEVRLHVLDTALDEGYKAMAADQEREADALVWCNALAVDQGRFTREFAA
ncbi:hypothetical protein ACSDBR_15560 [Acidithiobacillus ferriphilus]|uniref:hypothetical protein n=1 Tax=Acidithiobacillus ferriphilus TaxID=1689834 RepID=UPI003F5139D5